MENRLLVGISTGFAKVAQSTQKPQKCKKKFIAFTLPNLSAQLQIFLEIEQFEIFDFVQDFSYEKLYTILKIFEKKLSRSEPEAPENLKFSDGFQIARSQSSEGVTSSDLGCDQILIQFLKILRGFLKI